MRTQWWRPVATVLVANLLVLIAMVFLAGPAAAHADLVGTAPRADQVLEAAPGRVELVFSDSIDLNTSVVRIIEPNGATTDGLGPLSHLNGAAESVTVDLPNSLSRGTRTVVYRVVSTDGHPVQGSFRFSVGVATASAAPDVLGQTNGMVGLGLGLARWVAFVGLALTVGTLLLVFLGWPAGVAVPTVRVLLWTGLGSLSLASLASLALYGPYISGSGFAQSFDPELLDLALGTRVGQLLGARLALLAVVGAVLYLWLRKIPTGSPADPP
ncbi:copper resistance CopC family protein, partial [Sporichthya polymorpha]|uniref:copper resistance CopC family protein n=1 Tax=Sporichthya polymorpha TaxID=35751 RepID=UPI00035F0534